MNENRRLCASAAKVLEFCHECEAKRDSLPYEIDGVVSKVDSIPQQETLGYTSQSAALGHRLQVRRAPGRNGA